MISSITKDLVENDEFKVEKPKERLQPSAIPTLLSYKPYNDAITKWNNDNGKGEENNFEALFAKRYIVPDDDADNSDSETEIDNVIIIIYFYFFNLIYDYYFIFISGLICFQRGASSSSSSLWSASTT